MVLPICHVRANAGKISRTAPVGIAPSPGLALGGRVIVLLRSALNVEHPEGGAVAARAAGPKELGGLIACTQAKVSGITGATLVGPVCVI